MSAKKPGSILRDKIATLLKLNNSTVKIEYPLASTTADIFYVEEANKKFQMKIAIESKDWNKSLTSADLASIDNLYRPSINSGEIDYLWIISNHELAQSPSATIEKLNKVRYSTYDQFLTSIMNFGMLIEDNIIGFKNHESSKNFITSRTIDSGIPLFDYTKSWLKDKDSNTLLVYGGYGIGKTSFSHFIASELSKEYQSGDFNRIPIRISLGGLYTKQDLKALISSTLTGSEGGPSVGNFSFNLFLRLIAEGHLLLILDGFDEMRHAMEIHDFIFTFEQMTELFQGNSKTIILGRPDSFFSEDEEEKVFSSLYEGNPILYKTVDKIEVALLDNKQILDYLHKHIKAMNLNKNDSEMLLDLISIVANQERDVLSRPVQLSMFTKIMKNYIGKKDIISRYQLYYDFIYGFVKREDGKAARRIQGISIEGKMGFDDPRTIFMQRVAWWLLMIKKENRFHPSELPREFLPPAFRHSKNSDVALREAIVGSVIERKNDAVFKLTNGVLKVKGANYFYFPHKSYMEFLVAEYFCREQFSKEMFVIFFKNINPEILSFLREMPGVYLANLRMGLSYALGTLPRELICVSIKDSRLAKEIADEKKWNLEPMRIYEFYEYHLKHSKPSEIESYLLKVLLGSLNASRICASINIIAHYLRNTSVSDEYIKQFVASLINSIDYQALGNYFTSISGIGIYNIDSSNIRLYCFHKIVRFKDGKVRVSVESMEAIGRNTKIGSVYISGYENDLGVNNRLFKVEKMEVAALIGERHKLVFEHINPRACQLVLYGAAQSVLEE